MTREDGRILRVVATRDTLKAAKASDECTNERRMPTTKANCTRMKTSSGWEECVGNMGTVVSVCT